MKKVFFYEMNELIFTDGFPKNPEFFAWLFLNSFLSSLDISTMFFECEIDMKIYLNQNNEGA